MTNSRDTNTVHVPVLLQDVITILAIQPGDIVVDGTLGGGGHAEEILKLLGPSGRYLGIDADQSALLRVQKRLSNDTRVVYALGNFRDMESHVARAAVTHVDKILLDLGLSSDQLEVPTDRGFSFTADEPLRMTFALRPEEGVLTAWHVVNEWSEESLADILYGFGGETRSRKIARAICEARVVHPIDTSTELAKIVTSVVAHRGHVHPATKTFQAIRMAVNDELGALSEVLKASMRLLAPGGRIAIISFHSLEDRAVKLAFREWEKNGQGVRVTKRPIHPTDDECRRNRRARSAKLRCFQKGS